MELIVESEIEDDGGEAPSNYGIADNRVADWVEDQQEENATSKPENLRRCVRQNWME
jgi:hypothetical protein